MDVIQLAMEECGFSKSDPRRAALQNGLELLWSLTLDLVFHKGEPSALLPKCIQTRGQALRYCAELLDVAEADGVDDILPPGMFGVHDDRMVPRELIFPHLSQGSCLTEFRRILDEAEPVSRVRTMASSVS
jgi:hypothetical protein